MASASSSGDLSSRTLALQEAAQKRASTAMARTILDIVERKMNALRCVLNARLQMLANRCVPQRRWQRQALFAAGSTPVAKQGMWGCLLRAMDEHTDKSEEDPSFPF